MPLTRNSTLQRVGKSLSSQGATLATSAASIVIGFAASVGLARGLNVAERGELASLVVIPALLSFVAVFGYDEGLIGVRRRESENCALGRRFIVKHATTVAAPFGVLASGYLVLRGAPIEQILLLGALPVVGASRAWALALLAGTGRISSWNASRVLQPVIYLAAVGLLSVNGLMTVSLALASLTASTLVALLVALRLSNAGNRGSPAERQTEFDAEVRGLGNRLQLGNLASQMRSRVGLIAVTWIMAPSDIGVYAVATGLAMVPGGIYASQTRLSYARLIAFEPSEVSSQFRREMGRLALFYIVVSGLGVVISPHVIPWVYGSKYAGAVDVAQVLFGGSFFLGITMVLSTLAKLRSMPWLVTVAEVVALFVAIGLVLPMSSRFGSVGAAVAASVSSAVAALTLGILLERTSTNLSSWRLS